MSKSNVSAVQVVLLISAKLIGTYTNVAWNNKGQCYF